MKCQKCLDAQFQNALGRVQVQLHHLAGPDQVAVERAAGHSQGPKFKWVNACSEAASDRCGSTVLSRAWSISACWLRTVLTAKKWTTVQSAKWRILFHSIDTQSKDARLQAGLTDFEAWRKCISREALDLRAWVKVFYRAAIKRQKQCEEQAAAFAAEAFSNWLQEGPMCGLKRQHQLSRTATGWIPTKVAQPLANDFEPIDEVDGLSPEQLGSISLAGQEESPLTAQQIANDERCKWGGEWAVGEKWEEPEWSEFEVNEHPLPISVSEFRWALMTFPAGTGLGWDAIHPRALNRLDDDTIQVLIDLIIVCEKVGKWPAATDLVVVVLLPKTDRGWRPIGLLSFLPRIQM